MSTRWQRNVGTSDYKARCPIICGVYSGWFFYCWKQALCGSIADVIISLTRFTLSWCIHNVCGQSLCQWFNIHILTTAIHARTWVMSAAFLYALHSILACSPCYKYISVVGNPILSCFPCICWLPPHGCHVLLSSEGLRGPRLLVVSGTILSGDPFFADKWHHGVELIALLWSWCNILLAPEWSLCARHFLLASQIMLSLKPWLQQGMCYCNVHCGMRRFYWCGPSVNGQNFYTDNHKTVRFALDCVLLFVVKMFVLIYYNYEFTWHLCHMQYTSTHSLHCV
jgi:hypothetical protein